MHQAYDTGNHHNLYNDCRPYPPFIKPGELDLRIKDQIRQALLSTVQLQNFIAWHAGGESPPAQLS